MFSNSDLSSLVHVSYDYPTQCLQPPNRDPTPLTLTSVLNLLLELSSGVVKYGSKRHLLCPCWSHGKRYSSVRTLTVFTNNMLTREWVVTIVVLLMTLIVTGLYQYMPHHLLIMQRRALYYLFGSEGSERSLWQWMGIGNAGGNAAVLNDL